MRKQSRWITRVLIRVIGRVQDEGDEVEKVVEHNNLGDEGIEYRMRFKGYTAKDDFWFHESNCKESNYHESS